MSKKTRNPANEPFRILVTLACTAMFFGLLAALSQL